MGKSFILTYQDSVGLVLRVPTTQVSAICFFFYSYEACFKREIVLPVRSPITPQGELCNQRKQLYLPTDPTILILKLIPMYTPLPLPLHRHPASTSPQPDDVNLGQPYTIAQNRHMAGYISAQDLAVLGMHGFCCSSSTHTPLSQENEAYPTQLGTTTAS